MSVPRLDQRFRDTAARPRASGRRLRACSTRRSGPLSSPPPRGGLCRIAYDAEPEAQAERLARAYGARVLRAPTARSTRRRELDDYFAGPQTFELKSTSALAAVPPAGCSRELAACRTAG